MPTCQGILTSGNECGKRTTHEQTLCGTHRTQLAKNGPNLTAQKTLKYKYNKQRHEIMRKYTVAHLALGVNEFALDRQYQTELIMAKATYDVAHACLLIDQREQIYLTGINPDAEANARRALLAEQRRAARQRQWNEWQANMERRRLEDEQFIAEWGGNRRAAAVPRPEGLAGFAQDRQNIHTEVVVRQTKDIIEKILKIEVPDGYRWNKRICSKTPFEIGLMCDLTPAATNQMTGFYTRDEPIYELENGIYGKVLDCVWQYIQKSDDKGALQKILKVEMEDNIGMCAQGNLSRIVNIMAGYFDEIKISEPFSEVLGRRLPALIEIDDNDERLTALLKVYDEINLPKDVWVMWAEPLFDDMTVELTDGVLVVH